MRKIILKNAMAVAAMAIAAVSYGLMSFGTTNNANLQETAFFEFTGSHGQESNVNLWTEIDQSTYEDLACNGLMEGCKIESNSVTGTAPNRKPSSVPVDANSRPTISGPTVSAAYKN